MKKELTFALNYALNKGFQIHPNAFAFLENVDVKKLEKIIKEIVREKTKQKLFQINQDDLENYFGLKEDKNLECNYKILYSRGWSKRGRIRYSGIIRWIEPSC